MLGSDGRLSGRGSPTWSRIGKVWADHGVRSEAKVSMCSGGRPQVRVEFEFHFRVIGYGTAWRPVYGSRHVLVEGKQDGRVAAAGLVVGEAHAMRRA